MTDKRGNQTNYDLGLAESGDLSTVGDLFNPGHPDSGKEPRDPRGPVKFDQGQDISQAAKTTLGNYLSNATRGNVGVSRTNTFQVSPESSDAGSGVDNNLSSKRAALARFDIESNGTTVGTYLDHAKGYTDANKAARKFESTKNSDYGNEGTNPFVGPDIQIKNYSDIEARRRGHDGNSILLNVEPRGTAGAAEPGNPQIGPLRDDAPVIQKKISEVLKQNRFNPIEKAFVQNHTLSGTGTTLQRRLGSYVKDGAKEIRQDLLEQVGLKLMIRSTGHSVPGQDLLDSTNNLQLTNNLAPLIPSAPQLTGLPLIDTVNLRAGNVAIAENIEGVGVTPESARSEYISGIYPQGIDRSQTDSRDAFTGKTYGVLNSHIEPFGGPLPVGTFTTTVAGIIVLVGASALVSLLPLLLGGNTNARPRLSTLGVDPSMLIKGKRAYRGSEKEGYTNDNIQEYILSLLGIPKTDHNWGQCLLVGIGTFFGIEIKPGIAGQGATVDTDSILSSLFNLVTAPGYYAVIIRNAIRDTEQIVRAIEDFGSAVSNINVVAAISGLFKIIESITSSALYKFIMAMTSLGNQVLNYVPETLEDIANYPNVEGLRMRSRISESTAERGDRDLTSRLLDGDLGRTNASALSWKHSAPRSMYILPQNFSNAHTLAGRTNMVSAAKGLGKLAPSDDSATARVVTPESAGSRISSDRVEEIERRLEAEYVPFYFHDLRTNEIISFHAFLTDLSDGFTANYNSTAAYGRGDEVMVYSSTKRSISLGFQVVATSDQDFDVMYWNINKLITMLYPQYSKGRTMVSGDTKFIQPFSQIPTASPMIRLRIGDIIKGNYSKFGLSRLFGMGQDRSSFNVGDSVADDTSQSNEDREAAIRREFLRNLRSRPKRVGDAVKLSRIVRNNPIWCNIDGVPAVTIDTRTPAGARAAARGTVGRIVPGDGVPNPLSIYIVEQGRGLGVPSDTEVEIVEVREDFAGTISAIASGAGLNRLSSPGESVALDSNQPQYLVKLLRTPSAAGYSEEGIAEQFGNYRYFYVYQNEVTDYADSAPVYTNQISEEIRNRLGESDTQRSERKNREISDFFNKNNNPIVRSFESARGRGLAGFITDLKMDWADATWETDPEKRAPKSMKLSISFSPIHDIPMGLDSSGMMRSVAYNVGSMSNTIGGDPYDLPSSAGSSSSTGKSST